MNEDLQHSSEILQRSSQIHVHHLNEEINKLHDCAHHEICHLCNVYLGCQRLAGLVPSLEYYVFGLKAYVLEEVYSLSLHLKQWVVWCHLQYFSQQVLYMQQRSSHHDRVDK